MPAEGPTGTPRRARLDGRDVTAVVTEAGLDVDGRVVSWLDADDVVEGDHAVALTLADGTTLALTHTGATHDAFLADLRAARRAARYPSLTVVTGEPLLSVVSRDPAGWADVHLFPSALVIEPRTGRPTSVPLPLVERVTRDGHVVRLECRAVPDVELRALGAQTDEVVDRIERAGRDLRAATAAAYAAYDADLAGFTAPDGWAVARADDPDAWGRLQARALAGSRQAEVALLAELAGDGLAFGCYTEGGASSLPFVLAPVGGRIAVEATDADDRATFVFAIADAAELNALLLSTGFRREAISLPEEELGRWAVAVRTSSEVQRARAALVARVVHGEAWADGVRAALAV